MRKSEQCDQLYAALALARTNFGPIARTKTAKITGKSKTGELVSYSYKYAPLEECFGAVDKALSDQGLALVGGAEYDEAGHLWVITHLGHTSGQWIENALDAGLPIGIKEAGGMITYARRYGVTLTLQIQAEDDDDDQRAEGAPTKATTPRRAQDTNKSAMLPTQTAPKPPTDAEKKATLVEQILTRSQTIPDDAKRRDIMKHFFSATTVKELKSLPYDALLLGDARLQEFLAHALDPDDLDVADTFPSEVDVTVDTPPPLPASAVDDDGLVVKEWVDVLARRAKHFGEAAEERWAQIQEEYPAFSSSEWAEKWAVLGLLGVPT